MNKFIAQSILFVITAVNAGIAIQYEHYGAGVFSALTSIYCAMAAHSYR